MAHFTQPHYQPTYKFYGSADAYAVCHPRYSATPPPPYYQVEASYGQEATPHAHTLPMTQPRSIPDEWGTYYPPSSSFSANPPPAPRLEPVPLPPCTPLKPAPVELSAMPCLSLASGTCSPFDLWGKPPVHLTAALIQPATQPPCTQMVFTNPLSDDLPAIIIYPSRRPYVTINDILTRVYAMCNIITLDTYLNLRNETQKMAEKNSKRRVRHRVGPVGVTELDVLGDHPYFAGIRMDDTTNRWNFVIFAYKH